MKLCNFEEKYSNSQDFKKISKAILDKLWGLSKGWMTFHDSCDRRHSCIRKIRLIVLYKLNILDWLLWIRIIRSYSSICIKLFLSSSSVYVFSFIIFHFFCSLSLPSTFSLFLFLILNEQLLSVRECSKHCEFNNEQII